MGIIYPPPDLRAVVNKTAQFVAKNGVQFERRVMAAERGNLKFAFLQLDNPYRAYYDFMVSEYQAGRGPAAPNTPAPDEGAEQRDAEKQQQKHDEEEKEEVKAKVRGCGRRDVRVSGP